MEHLLLLNTETMAWSRPRCTGHVPPGRYGASLVYNEAEGKVWVFGGWDAIRSQNDLYEATVAVDSLSSL